MVCGKFVCNRPERGFGIAAGADHVRILTEGRPEIHRRYGNQKPAFWIGGCHECMDFFKIFKILTKPAYLETVSAHISALIYIRTRG